MKKKSASQLAFSNLRALIAFLVYGSAACSILSGALLGFLCSEAPAKSSQRTLTFAQRVACQYAIEEVYWRHRIWPQDNPDPKPSLDAVMSQAQLERKVADYLRDSQALDDYWQRPITADDLQAEMDRMAKHTRQPEVLRELFTALGDDPFLVAECLARPLLAKRLVTKLNNEDCVDLTTIAWLKGPLRSSGARAETQALVTMAALDASYTLPTIVDGPNGCIDDTWTSTSITNAPDGRLRHTAVWTGTEMIVWGGTTDRINGLGTGGRYNPSTDSWTATSTTNAPTVRFDHTAVWTGSEMIVWGGYNNSSRLNTGARYNPSTDTWTATSTSNAPTGRFDHTAVWTGSEMIVWGGIDTISYANTGGRYNPTTDTWIATSTTNAPTGRLYHTAAWTGSEMIVWGGQPTGGGYLNTGGKYNPSNDSWTATSTAGAPDARELHTTVWTGSEMIVWGGYGGSSLNTGGKYDPSSDSWTATSTTNTPTARLDHTAAWTGNEMIVWGGDNLVSNYDTGARYDAATDSWTTTTTSGAPAARYWHTAVWTDSEMIVWGGTNDVSAFNSGGKYCAQSGPTPTPTPTPGEIILRAKKKRIEGINTVRLQWRQATSPNVDVYRNNVLIATTPNDGRYDDSTGDTGRARYVYRVCEAGTQTCSNDVTVHFPP
jgi:N-acetylneuraminic acid mutarotase